MQDRTVIPIEPAADLSAGQDRLRCRPVVQLVPGIDDALGAPMSDHRGFGHAVLFTDLAHNRFEGIASPAARRDDPIALDDISALERPRLRPIAGDNACDRLAG